MNGLSAARGLRRSVDEAGGSMRISVTALGDTFGRGRMTARARTGIDGVLRRAGLEARPSLTHPARASWVTLRALPDADVPPAPAAAGLFMPSLPPRLAAATGLLMPVFLVVAVALADGPRPTPSTASAPAARGISLLDQADAALLAGEYRRAVALTQQADPTRVARVRGTIVSALTAQATSAQRRGAYVRAIRLSRRAARFGSAPGAKRIVVQSRAGLDLRRRGWSVRR